MAEWTCSACTLTNESNKRRCKVCGGRKPLPIVSGWLLSNRKKRKRQSPASNKNGARDEDKGEPLDVSEQPKTVQDDGNQQAIDIPLTTTAEIDPTSPFQTPLVAILRGRTVSVTWTCSALTTSTTTAPPFGHQPTIPDEQQQTKTRACSDTDHDPFHQSQATRDQQQVAPTTACLGNNNNKGNDCRSPSSAAHHDDPLSVSLQQQSESSLAATAVAPRFREASPTAVPRPLLEEEQPTTAVTTGTGADHPVTEEAMLVAVEPTTNPEPLFTLSSQQSPSVSNNDLLLVASAPEEKYTQDSSTSSDVGHFFYTPATTQESQTAPNECVTHGLLSPLEQTVHQKSGSGGDADRREEKGTETEEGGEATTNIGPAKSVRADNHRQYSDALDLAASRTSVSGGALPTRKGGRDPNEMRVLQRGHPPPAFHTAGSHKLMTVSAASLERANRLLTKDPAASDAMGDAGSMATGSATERTISSGSVSKRCGPASTTKNTGELDATDAQQMELPSHSTCTPLPIVGFQTAGSKATIKVSDTAVAHAHRVLAGGSNTPPERGTYSMETDRSAIEASKKDTKSDLDCVPPMGSFRWLVLASGCA